MNEIPALVHGEFQRVSPEKENIQLPLFSCLSPSKIILSGEHACVYGHKAVTAFFFIT